MKTSKDPSPRTLILLAARLSGVWICHANASDGGGLGLDNLFLSISSPISNP
jgi:hypothetical protein